MNSGAMLNAYPDSLGGRLSGAVELLGRPELKDVFHSFYVLPSVFDTDLDRGFSVVSYDLSREYATQADIDGIHALGLDLKLDFILNHLSVLSPQFQDLLARGDESPYRDFFIDWNAFWAGKGEMTDAGYIQPDPALIREMNFRKPGLPILMVRLPDGRDVPYWNTFYQEVRYPRLDAQDVMQPLSLQYGQAQRLCAMVNAALDAGVRPAEMELGDFKAQRAALTELLESRRRYLGQMDLNLRSDEVWRYYGETLARLAGYGASIVRLDAFAYAPKAPGARNFFNEPDTWDVLERLRQMAQPYGVTLLPEIHASYAEGRYAQVSEKGYMTYDFFLPGLLLDALENGDAASLAAWAREQREKNIRAVNMLGCHDGIPVLDLRGLIPEERIERLIDVIVSRGGLVKNLHGQKNVYYQVNATYFSALGEDERRMLLARAVQLCMPGKPQIWYLDLFAGKNDVEAVQRGGAAGHKEINRTNLTAQMIEEGLSRPVVSGQLEMLRMRNTCRAFDFDAQMQIDQPEKQLLHILWRKDGDEAELHADLKTCAFTFRTLSAGVEKTFRQ